MASAKPQTQRQNQASGRVLRIGVILGGKLIEEKLIRERRDVTVGQSAKNTFAIPADELPRIWPLFVMQNGRYVLRFTESMDGRLADGDAVKTFAELQGKAATRQGDAWVLPLDDSSRGKVVVGELTLLFQFVAAPPRQPRPQLPASVRGTFADRIDPMLAIILAISLLLHFGVGLYAYQRDRVVKTRSMRIFNETFQRPTVAAAEIEVPKVEDDKPTEAEKPEEAKQPDKSSSSAAKSQKPKGDGQDAEKPGRSAEESLRMQEEARALALDLMTGGFSESALDRGGGDRDPKNDLDAVIGEINRSGAAVSDIGGGSGRDTRDDGGTQIGTGQGPEIEGPGETTAKTAAKTAEKVPRTRVSVGGSSSDDDTTLRPDEVMRKIQSVYMAGLKRCHKELLKRDPSAGGTVSLKFMVGPMGRVTRAKANGFDPGVDRCIEKQAQSWRFGVPKDEDGEATEATFKISLVLQAE